MKQTNPPLRSVVLLALFLSGFMMQPVLAGNNQTQELSKPGHSNWSVRISGLLQFNSDSWELWYEEGADTPDYSDDFIANNGVQGKSLGLEIALTRRLGERFGLGLAVGCIPTRLHAEIHHLPTIEAPKANIAYCPVRFSFFYDILRWSDWRMQFGLQGGLAFFGDKDVVSLIGKSRHFYGGISPMFGLETAVTYAPRQGLGFSAVLSKQFTHFHAEELHTGNLPQQISFSPFALSVGILYEF